MDPRRLVLAQQATTLQNLARQRAANPAPAQPLRTLDDIRALAVQRHVERQAKPHYDPRTVPVRAALSQVFDTQGNQALAANATPLARQAHLQDLANQIAQTVGVRRAKVDALTPGGQIQEQPGIASTTYTPAGAADPVNRRIMMPPNGDNGFGGPPAAMVSPMMNRAREYSQQATLAHEMGHVTEPDLVRNYARVRKVLEILGVPTDPRAPVLRKSLAGRADMNRANPVRRDQSGMPIEGPGGIHSAPNETYADLVGAALGFRDRVPPELLRKLTALAQQRLVPRPRSQPLGISDPPVNDLHVPRKGRR